MYYLYYFTTKSHLNLRMSPILVALNNAHLKIYAREIGIIMFVKIKKILNKEREIQMGQIFH